MIDRKELSVTTTEMAVAETRSTQVTTETAPPPAPAPVYAPPPAPAPAPSAPMETTLPQTATRYPLAATAGLLLLVAGIALRLRS